MKINKVREMDAAEIESEDQEIREQMFRLRLQIRMGQADGLKKYRALRKGRARMLTVKRERQMASEKKS